MLLVGSAQAAAQHAVPFPLAWAPHLRSTLIFTSFSPTDTRPAQCWRLGVAAKAQRREKALKSHFMKHPCSGRPSHAAGAPDFPFSTHPAQSWGWGVGVGGWGTASPCSRPSGSPGESEFPGQRHRGPGSRPRFWHLPRGPQLAVVTARTG